MNMKRMSSIVLAILAWILLVGASTGLQVSVHSGKLDIIARDAQLVDVMTALDEQAEITFRVIGDAEISQFQISDEFKGLPLDKAIARLLKGLSYSLVRDKSGKPSKVIILGKDERGGANWEDTSHPQFDGNEAGDVASEMSQSPTEASTTETGHSPQTAEAELVQAVETAQAARTPEEKADALRRLGDFQDPRTLEVLQPALGAEETEVRSAALEAMRWGTVYEPQALKEVRNLVGEDEDPQVKRSALEVIVRYDTSIEARELLEGIAIGSDKTLKEFANRELQRMDEEAAAASSAEVEQQDMQLGDEATAPVNEEDGSALAELEQQDIQPEEGAALIDNAAAANSAEVEQSQLQPEGEPDAPMGEEGETSSAEVEQQDVQPGDEEAAPVDENENDQ